MLKDRVTPSQFFSLLYLSVLSSIFMYIADRRVSVAQTDSLLRPLVFAVVSIVAFLPMCYLMNKYKVFSQEQRNELSKSKMFKIISVVYGVVYLFDALITAARFDLFASSELFPGKDMTFFLVGLIIVCCFLSHLGLGGLSRASTVFVMIVVLATGFAALTLFQEVDFLNFIPVFENGVTDFAKDSLYFSIQASEIGTIPLVVSNIKGNVKKNYLLWSILSAVSFSVILFFVVGILGEFADTQLFPTYAAISLAEFGLFERLDALETAIWILCIVVKLTFFIYIIVQTFSFSFKKINKHRKLFSAFIGVAIALILVFVSSNIVRFSFVSSAAVAIGVYVVPVIILPAILIGVNFIYDRRKNYEKN